MAEKSFGKRFACPAAIVFAVLQVLALAGCWSVEPLSEETILKYNLSYNPDRFKAYQYYISRDIVLIYNDADTRDDENAGGDSPAGAAKDVKQILSSTPGVVLDYAIDENNGVIKLGIAFQKDNDNLLWFAQDPSKEDNNFYLVYTDLKNGRVSYDGRLYTVSYEKPTGIEAGFIRMFLKDKTEGK
ncbi:MAG: hypothetical protein LBU28_08190, partial [Spirochaetaceae bacterium]|nr:hypothetical protein [Spirochaetaceae bacterium]